MEQIDRMDVPAGMRLTVTGPQRDEPASRRWRSYLQGYDAAGCPQIYDASGGSPSEAAAAVLARFGRGIY